MRSGFLSREKVRSALGSPLFLFTAEGALFQFANSINGFGNNLYTTNLNASDTQIGMIQLVPNLAALLLMLPLGLMSDRARKARTVPMLMLAVMVAGYALMSLVPEIAGARIVLFFGALAMQAGGMALYNAQWQSFFGTASRLEERNGILTMRNRVMFAIGIAAPIVCGMLMGRQQDQNGKLMILQCFYICCAAAIAIQLVVISMVPERHVDQSRASTPRESIRRTLASLARDKAFRLFFLPVMLFYMTWHLDWSMWYIGQTQYLLLDEIQLSIVSGVFNVGQLIAVGVLSRIVPKRGTDRVFTYAAVGLCFCPVIMVGCSLLPIGLRFPAFLVTLTVLNAPQCAVNLCVVQMLLRVTPEGNRGLTVSLYNMAIILSNCVMPLAGVQLYQALGANFTGMASFNGIVFALRLAAMAVLFWRCGRLRKLGYTDETQPFTALHDRLLINNDLERMNDNGKI